MKKTQFIPETGCLRWTAQVSGKGYGKYWDGRNCFAHRFGYEHTYGPVPEGLVLDHFLYEREGTGRLSRCIGPSCVEPTHLRPSTVAENCRRSARSHCAQGHEFTPENTMIRGDRGRRCRTCDNAHRKLHYDLYGAARRRAARAAAKAA